MATKARGEIARVFFLVDGEPQKEPHPDATAIIWKFSDESSVEIPVASIPTPMLKCAAQFGIKTKLRNAYADAIGVKAARGALDAALANLRNGDWNAAERQAANFALLPDALAQVLGIDRDEAVAKIAQRDGEEQAAYRKRLATIASEPRVAKALVDLKPKGAEVDLASLLA